MKSKIVLVLLSLMSAGVQAGVIKGKIKDAQTGEEIIGASVISEGRSWKRNSNPDWTEV